MPTPSPTEPHPHADPSAFSGLWIPLITPFCPTPERPVDHPALAKLASHYASQGASGLVVCGTTGEAAALDKPEQWAVLETVLAHCAGLPVVMGLSSYHLGDALAFVRQAAGYPLAGLLVSAPHYIRPSQAGVQQWFEAIADAAAQPLIVYDVPYRSGVEITLPTLQNLSRHANIQAVKDCGGNAAKTQTLIADGQLAVLAGEDHQIFGTLASGGAGAIAASAHLRTADFAQVIRLIQAQKLDEARSAWRPLVPLITALFSEPNPGVIKAALAHTGQIANVLRAPLQAASQPFKQALLEM